jgi:hypothetical protein
MQKEYELKANLVKKQIKEDFKTINNKVQSEVLKLKIIY